MTSTTSTIGPNRCHGCLQWDRSAGATTREVEDFFQRWSARFFDKLGAQVLLKRLTRGGGTLPKHSMGLLGNILDLSTWHGANLAPEAPNSNHSLDEER